MSTSIAAELEALAERIRRIRGVGRNGDAAPFYEDRSQAARDVQQLAEWSRTGRMPAGYVPITDRGRENKTRARYGRRR